MKKSPIETVQIIIPHNLQTMGFHSLQFEIKKNCYLQEQISPIPLNRKRVFFFCITVQKAEFSVSSCETNYQMCKKQCNDEGHESQFLAPVFPYFFPVGQTTK